MYYELQPAYGRDYKTAKEVKAAFEAGKDFQGDYQLGFKYVNKPQLKVGDNVLLRYKKNTMVTAVKIKDLTTTDPAAKEKTIIPGMTVGDVLKSK